MFKKWLLLDPHGPGPDDPQEPSCAVGPSVWFYNKTRSAKGGSSHQSAMRHKGTWRHVAGAPTGGILEPGLDHCLWPAPHNPW